jgi:hypothetical protein
VNTEESTPGPTVLGHHRAGQRPEMLGNISAAERPQCKEGQRRRRGDITVRVSFEAHRLATTYVATAYEQLVPLRRRGRRAAAGAGPAQADQRPGERAGA